MNELYELKEMLLRELMECGARKELSPSMLDRVDRLAHATKNLCKVIEAMEAEPMMSYEGGSYEGSSNRSMRGYSREGNSYARGRGRYAARDSMGRYSGANEDAVKKLEKLMGSAPDEHFRQKLQEIADALEE